MKINLNYKPMNWNEYINLERKNFYAANTLKQKEKTIVKMMAKDKYEGEYPIELIFKPHFKDHRQDLDNFRYKGIIDGLVSCGVLKNDNLNCIQKISLEPIFDSDEIVEIEIKGID